MELYLSATQAVTEEVHRLERELGAFANKMRSNADQLRIDSAYKIPFRNTPTVADDYLAEVELLEGDAALEHIISGLTTIRLELGAQSQRETLRAVGLAALPDDWLAELNALNERKALIEATAKTIDCRNTRTALWHSFKTLSALQTMRRNWIIEAPASVRFYWDNAPSMVTQSVAEWIAQYTQVLKDYFGYVPHADELENQSPFKKYAIAVTQLGNLDAHERLACYRAGKPHVRARVTFSEGAKPVIRPCPTPILYSINQPAPLIKPLPDMEPLKPDCARCSRAKIEVEPFIEALYLHRYLEPYRQC